MPLLLIALHLLLVPVTADHAQDSRDLGISVIAPADFPAPQTADFLQRYLETDSPLVVDVSAPTGTLWQLCIQQGNGSTLPGPVEWRLGNQVGNLAPEEVKIASGSGNATVEIDLRIALRWTVHTPDTYSLSVLLHVYEGDGEDCQEGEL